jgi:streptogramin lyase
MTKKTFTYITLIISFYCLIGCKSQNDPTPLTLNSIDKALLKGWWATSLTNNSQTKIYFGEDNFFYQDTVKEAAPIAGFWRTLTNTVAYSAQLNGSIINNFEITKLTANELTFKTGATTATFTKITLPAITSAPISTIAGTGAFGYTGDGGPALSAQISATAGIFVDKTGNIYFCDRGNQVIRKISAADGKITTIAGTGNSSPNSINFADNSPALSIDLADPVAITMDDTQNFYITEALFNRIDKITADGKITCVAGCSTIQGSSGDGGPAKLATFTYPQGLAVDPQGNLYITSDASGKIRKVSNGIITTIAGTGAKNYNGDGISAINANITPFEISINAKGDIYFTEIDNYRIRKITAATGNISTIAGTGIRGGSGDNGLAVNAQVIPLAIKTLANGDVYFTDMSNTVRKIDGSTGIITRVAGTGYKGYTGDGIHAGAYSLDNPYGLATDATGNLYISEVARIRKIATN